MPIHVNGVNITSVNVNGSPINYVNVNGANVWSREWDYLIPIRNTAQYNIWNIDHDYGFSVYGWNVSFGGVYFDIDASKIFKVTADCVNFIPDAGTGRYYELGIGTSTATLPNVYSSGEGRIWYTGGTQIGHNQTITYELPVSNVVGPGIYRVYVISATCSAATCNSAIGYIHVYGRG